MERKPDTVVLSFQTSVDYVVDLQTGAVKTEYEAVPIGALPYNASTWAEGELLSEEAGSPNTYSIDFDEVIDREAFRVAMQLVRAAQAEA